MLLLVGRRHPRPSTLRVPLPLRRLLVLVNETFRHAQGSMHSLHQRAQVCRLFGAHSRNGGILEHIWEHSRSRRHLGRLCRAAGGAALALALALALAHATASAGAAVASDEPR